MRVRLWIIGLFLTFTGTPAVAAELFPMVTRSLTISCDSGFRIAHKWTTEEARVPARATLERTCPSLGYRIDPNGITDLAPETIPFLLGMSGGGGVYVEHPESGRGDYVQISGDDLFFRGVGESFYGRVRLDANGDPERLKLDILMTVPEDFSAPSFIPPVCVIHHRLVSIAVFDNPNVPTCSVVESGPTSLEVPPGGGGPVPCSTGETPPFPVP